jgi:hypothetical protein
MIYVSFVSKTLRVLRSRSLIHPEGILRNLGKFCKNWDVSICAILTANTFQIQDATPKVLYLNLVRNALANIPKHGPPGAGRQPSSAHQTS